MKLNCLNYTLGERNSKYMRENLMHEMMCTASTFQGTKTCVDQTTAEMMSQLPQYFLLKASFQKIQAKVNTKMITWAPEGSTPQVAPLSSRVLVIKCFVQLASLH